MSRLFETIHVVQRTPQHLPYHNRRMNAARHDLFNCPDEIDLATILIVPDTVDDGNYKCRVVYRETIESVEFLPYTKRTINSLKLLQCDSIEYRYKYLDRSVLEHLLINIGADDIVIVKQGLITDTSYSNLAFFDGAQWITPTTPLLEGTARARLLETGRLITGDISPADLHRYSTAALINAMNDLDEAPTVAVMNIRW